MVSLFKPAKKFVLPLSVTLILTIYQLVRIIAFVNVYGGIEHDGGWMLSISRSLAEQGTYTTMVSTIVDPEMLGDINVDQKFDVQAPDGRIWFFTGNGIGPASIIPDALILKLFGTDFWALHIGPLLFYTAFLLLGAYILYRLAGLGAILLFHAFLFFYPHLSIFLGYEAMGEVPGMFYILWAYLAFAAAFQKQHQRWKYFFIAGLVVGLALNAKLITLWSISGIFLWAGILWLISLMQRSEEKRVDFDKVQVSRGNPQIRLPGIKPNFGELLWLSGGAALPIIIWELVHFIVLSRLVSFELYLRHAKQRLTFILDDGSGVGLQIHSGAEFFWDKFFLLGEVTHPQRWVITLIFLAILLGGLAFMWQWRRQPYRQHLWTPMWLGWLANTAWFVALAKTGWPRHFWFGLVLAVLLLCVTVVVFIKSGLGRYKSDFGRLIVGFGLLVLIGWGFASQPYVWGFFLPDEIIAYWQDKQINNKYDASLPWIIIPRTAQAEVIDYINQMPPEARVYYPGQHKSAEIPPQTGRVHYPLNRRNYLQPHPADIALIGPSVISPWKDPVQRRDLLQLVEQECPQPAVQNDFYMICTFVDNNVSR